MQVADEAIAASAKRRMFMWMRLRGILRSG
jgi:hypothetical protein